MIKFKKRNKKIINDKIVTATVSSNYFHFAYVTHLFLCDIDFTLSHVQVLCTAKCVLIQKINYIAHHIYSIDFFLLRIL